MFIELKKNDQMVKVYKQEETLSVFIILSRLGCEDNNLWSKCLLYINILKGLYWFEKCKMRVNVCYFAVCLTFDI